MPEKSIKICIIGGGLAGLALFHALHKSEHIDLHIFEAAPSFRESGLAIGFSRNAITALDLLGLRDRLTAAKAVQTHGTRCYIAQGEDTGKSAMAHDFAGNNAWSVQRSLFLAELLKGLDESRLHAGKKVKTVSQQGAGVCVEFEDGTDHTCDVLFGADGINSAIRKYVLDDPSAGPTFAGWQMVTAMASFDDAAHYFGSEIINTHDNATYAWIGHNTMLLHGQTTGQTVVPCILSRWMGEDNFERNRKTNKAELEKFVEDFDHPMGEKFIALITKDKEDFDMFPMHHHSPQASKYVKGQIALLGDAADSTTPWRGSAGGMSLEDALILGSCFQNKVKSTEDAKAALKAYETIQQPRRSRLVKDSYRAGLILCGLDDKIGLNAKKMNEDLETSWEWIIDIDMKQQVEKAYQLMRTQAASES